MPEPTEREFLEGLRYEDKFPDDPRCDLCRAIGSAWCNECALDVAAASSAPPRKEQNR